MAILTVPTTWNNEYIETIKGLQKKSAHKVTNFYGSLHTSILGSARPNVNLPKIDIKNIASHIQHINSLEFTFSYLFNAPFIPNFHYSSAKNNITNYIDNVYSALEGKNGNTVTMSSIELINFFKKRYNTRKVDIIASLTLNIENQPAIDYLKQFGIKKIMLSTNINRNIALLKNLKKK